jgi:hypothetical protein
MFYEIKVSDRRKHRKFMLKMNEYMINALTKKLNLIKS